MVKIKGLIPIILLSLIPVLLIWAPFLLRFKTFWTIPLPQQGMATIVANYDGPLYLAVAKTFYNPKLLGDNYQFPLSNEYYSAHFPLFPLLIRLFSPILGQPYSMLFITFVSSVFALYFFYQHANRYLSKENALFLTAVFSIFPARWLIVRSVGSPEPLFIALILSSTYYFAKKKYVFAGIAGFFAAMTKSPAILLFIVYCLQVTVPRLHNFNQINFKKYLPLLLVPLGLFAVFSIYAVRYGDFFTYFKSGDNIHLFFPPFQIFNFSAPWVGTFWLEEVIFIYLISVLGIYKLWQEKMKTYFYFSLVFFASLLFVAHRDLLRYSLPIVPFMLIAFRNTLLKKEFKIAMLVIIIPIYLYSLAFISQNVMPIADLTPFL